MAGSGIGLGTGVVDLAGRPIAGGGGSTLTDGLVAYWSLNESSAGASPVARVDSVGSNDLSDPNQVISGTGKINDAVDMRAGGSNDQLTAADHADLRFGATDWTIAAWYRPEATATAHGIVSKDGEAKLVRFPSANRLVIIVGDGNTTGSESMLVYPPTTLANDVWHLAIAWYVAATNTLGITADGGSVSTTNPAVTLGTSAANFVVGRVDADPNYIADAMIDEVAKWNRVLTSDERAELWNGGDGVDLSSYL